MFNNCNKILLIKHGFKFILKLDSIYKIIYFFYVKVFGESCKWTVWTLLDH